MSGIEIAGLVLKALPTAIETLQKYNEAVGEIKRWIKYKREARSLIRTLENEQARLANVYEKLLSWAVPDSEIEEMIADPGGPLWKDAKIQNSMRDRLRHRYKSFEKTMDDINEAMGQFEMKIAPLAEPGRKVSFFKRTAFALNRADFVDDLSKISDGITSLEEMTTQGMEMEPIRRVRSQSRFLTVLRNMSMSLFRALYSSLRCACSHNISLRLEFRSAEDVGLRYADEDIMREIDFQLLFSTRDAGSSVETCMEDLVVKVAPPEKKDVALPTGVPIQPCSHSAGPAPVVDRMVHGPKGVKKKGVSFAFSHTQVSSSTTLVETQMRAAGACSQCSLSSLTAGIANIGLSTPAPAINLCEKLRKAQKQKQVDCYGTILDDSPSVGAQYAVYPARPTLLHGDSSDLPLVSLRELLELSPPPLYTRFRLAMVVSSSVLQLHNTPWLPESVSSADIFFLKLGNDPLYTHTFVIKKLPESHAPTDTANATGLSYIVRNQALLYLSILLIELILGKPFDSLRAPAPQDTQPSAHSKLLKDVRDAQKLIPQAYNINRAYGSAIDRCIEGSFDRGKVRGLEDEQFRQDIYSSVVALLKRTFELPGTLE